MKNRRRKRLIDSAVQGALVRRILVHWLLFLGMACLTLPLWRIATGAEPLGPFTMLMTRGWIASAPVFVVLLAMLPLFVWDTVTFSQRFAGPMYRFHKTVRDLNAGEQFHPIRLRKGDFWMEFAEDFNTMVERMEERDKQQAELSKT